MKRKLIALLVVMLMASSLCLAGCSQEKAAKSSQSDQLKAGDTSKPAGNELENLIKSARDVKGMSYEMSSTISGQGQNLTTSSKVWISNGNMRMESEAAGMKSVILKNAKGEIWMYNPATNIAMKMSQLQNQDQLANKWAEDDSYASKMKIDGHEKLDGYDCVVVTVKDTETDSKMWLREDIGMPLKVESNVNNSSVVINFKNYNLGAQDESLFEVPAGAQQMEMPNTANMPKMP